MESVGSIKFGSNSENGSNQKKIYCNNTGGVFKI